LLGLIHLFLLLEDELGVVEVRVIRRVFVEHQAVYINQFVESLVVQLDFDHLIVFYRVD
jgi:hypothetical protein